jgi:glutathione S-transferase
MGIDVGIDIDMGSDTAAGHNSTRNGFPPTGMNPTGIYERNSRKASKKMLNRCCREFARSGFMAVTGHHARLRLRTPARAVPPVDQLHSAHTDSTIQGIAMTELTLWGFDGSTYVRTVKMLLAEKDVTDFDQVPLNVLKGDPKSAEHLTRHPFGKVPVLDHDGMRILETSAIVRYLNDVLPGRSLIPASAKDRARMDMMIGIIDSYGYAALLGVAGYHLFPDFVGGQNDAARRSGLQTGREVLALAMRVKGTSPFIAGDLSLADLYLAPIAFYVSLTPDQDALFDVDGFRNWWSAIQALPSYIATRPDLG